jgi:hypothetical protein
MRGAADVTRFIHQGRPNAGAKLAMTVVVVHHLGAHIETIAASYELLREPQPLALIVRSDGFSVKDVGSVEHFFEQ